jgi:hypothetical protein
VTDVGGRPRIYASNAERQKAYRDRQRDKKSAEEKDAAQREHERQRRREQAAYRRREYREWSADREQKQRQQSAEREQKQRQQRAEREQEQRQQRARYIYEFFPEYQQSLRVLGLASGATRQEIKAAYKRLVKVHHPDMGGSAAKFREVHAAYVAISRFVN